MIGDTYAIRLIRNATIASPIMRAAFRGKA